MSSRLASVRTPKREALLELAKLLANGAPAVVAELGRVFDDRALYLKQRARELSDRNVDPKRPPADLPWLALVIALVRARRIAPVDWKADLPDLLASLDRLVTRPKKSSRWAWTRTNELEGRSTLELLEHLGQRLSADFALALGRIDIASDSHELFLVDARHVERLATLAKKAGGGGVDFFTGRNLAKLERARLAEQKRAALTARKNPNAQRQFVHADGRVCVTWGDSWSVNGKRHYSLDVVHRRLGADAPGEQRISKRRTDIAKWRKPVVERCVRAGYVEISLDELAARDRAARDVPTRPKPRPSSTKRRSSGRA